MADNQKRVEIIIDTMLEGYTILTQMVHYGMGVMGKDHMNSMMDTAKICNLAVDMLLRDSESAGEVMGALEEVARKCEGHCRMVKDDENMIACAEVCKRVADEAGNL